MDRRWLLLLVLLYAMLALAVTAWPGRRDTLADLISFTTLYVLTWTLVAVWRYAELTHQITVIAEADLRKRLAESRIANKPLVFLNAELVPDRASAGRYVTQLVARNVGPGIAVNVHILAAQVDGRWDVGTIGAIEPGGSRVLTDRLDTRLEAHAGRMPGRIVLVEAMKTRTIQWIATLNTLDRHSDVRHKFVEGFAVAGVSLEKLLAQHGQRLVRALEELQREVS